MQVELFRYHATVRMSHTDAAGLLYFPNQLIIAHEAYEEWLQAAGFSMQEVLRRGEIFVPIVHCEADYRIPLFVGDKLVVELGCSERGEHSYTLSYKIMRGDELAGTVATVHVCVERTTMHKIPPPLELARALEKIAVIL